MPTFIEGFDQGFQERQTKAGFGQIPKPAAIPPMIKTKELGGARIPYIKLLAFNEIQLGLEHRFLVGGRAGPFAQLSVAHIPLGVRVVSADRWRQFAYRKGISTSSENRARQQAFKRASEHLIADGHVGFWDDQVWLVRKDIGQNRDSDGRGGEHTNTP